MICKNQGGRRDRRVNYEETDTIVAFPGINEQNANSIYNVTEWNMGHLLNTVISVTYQLGR